LDLIAGVGAPGRLADGRPRHPQELAAHERVDGHLKDGVSEPVLSRVFEYWRRIDQAIGERIAEAMKGA